MVPRSPLSRKRGSVAVSTTGSRMVTSPTARPTLLLAPGHRHHAGGAGEVRDVERDLRAAVGLDGDDAGIERQRRLGGRAALQLGAGLVAAGLDLAARALHAVDQLAIEIADLGRELALAEIVVVGRRRLVVGQVEDADVDRGHHDARLLAGGEAVDLERDAQACCSGGISVGRSRLTASVCALRSTLNHCTPMARPGMRLRRGVERTPQGRHHIGAAAPVVADRHAQAWRRPPARPASMVLQQPVADHVRA